MPKYFFLGIRLFLGILFVVSGFEKAIGPSENFLYVIRGYDVLPDGLARLASVTFPWVELLVGSFTLLGLWLDWSLRLQAVISVSFMVMVSQAIVRNLPLENCGCFGSLVHIPLKGVLILDVTMLVCAIACLKNLARARLFSLDTVYKK